MKKILLLGLIICLYFISCQPRFCKIADCGENAFCDELENECKCINGYLKDSKGKCTLRNVFRDAYLGTYIVSEQGMGANPAFIARVVSNAGEDNVSIYGHGGLVCSLGQEVPAVSIPGKVSPTGMTFTDYERYCNGVRYTFRGFSAAWVNDTTFMATYKVENDLGVVKDVTAAFIKQ